MKKSLSAFLAGLIFSLGLGISGMTQTQKVIGFLDIFGNWDPSLLFVMIGAIVIHSIAYKLIRIRKTPILTSTLHISTKTKITKSLIIGSIIFGVGWGLGGYCPGPAIVSVVTFDKHAIEFVFSMILGMIVFNIGKKEIQHYNKNSRDQKF